MEDEDEDEGEDECEWEEEDDEEEEQEQEKSETQSGDEVGTIYLKKILAIVIDNVIVHDNQFWR